MEYIYIMSCQRGGGAPEIHSIWSTYEAAIKEYYEYHIKDGYEKSGDDSQFWFMYLYKIPVNERFAVGNEWSKEKLTKSSKHRLKLKWGDVKKEWSLISRDEKLAQIGI